MKSPRRVDEYISNFPQKTKNKLLKIRSAIKEIAPESGEKISYGIPTATIEGKYFIYFAAFKSHISLYPVTPEVEKIKEINKYRSGKGTLRFTLEKPLPMPLIRKIIKARWHETHLE